jgi:hypothetical protein
MKPEIQHVLTMALECAQDELPLFLGHLRQIEATAMARLMSPGVSTAVHAAPDHLLGVRDAAERLGMSADYLYRHSAKFPFMRREGKRLLFSAHGIENYIKNRGVLTARRQGI